MLEKPLAMTRKFFIAKDNSFTAGQKPIRLALVDDETFDAIVKEVEARQRQRMTRHVNRWRRTIIKATAAVIGALVLSVIGNWVYAHIPWTQIAFVPQLSIATSNRS